MSNLAKLFEEIQTTSSLYSKKERRDNSARYGVRHTKEFERIEALPERDWETAADLNQLCELMTNSYKTPQGTMKLWPVQAAALRDIHDSKGLFAPIAVGAGKALISLLAPVVLQARRPVLLVPAQLRDQTLRKVLPEMREHWKLHPDLKVIGYSELSLEKNSTLLADIQPDLIVADECHYLKNLRAGRSRRVRRFMRELPDTVFVGLSGTVTNRTLRDYWHIIQWCLKENTPLPLNWPEFQDWANALDENVDRFDRMRPGALERFAQAGENARQGYARRLRATAGVVATSKTAIGTSLRVGRKQLAVPDALKSLMKQVQNDRETPAGDILAEPVDLWRCLQQLSCGFYYRWDPQPPFDWLEARRKWKKLVRHKIQHSTKFDTELQVWNDSSKSSDEITRTCYETWKAIKDTFEPNSVPVWVDDFLLRDASDWLRSNVGVCWVQHTAVGHRLSKLAGLPYFGAGDDGILDIEGSCIASVRAHGTGKNLQRYALNLVLAPPSSGQVWEQLLGRTHRPGQKADTVEVEVYQHTPVFVQSMTTAMNDARYLEDSLGSKQKLLYADFTFEVRK